VIAGASPIFARARATREVGRIEELALLGDADAVEDAGADRGLTAQLDDDRFEKHRTLVRQKRRRARTSRCRPPS